MPQSQFEFGEDLSEYVQTVARKLSRLGAEDVTEMLDLRTLVRVLEQRDEDLVTHLNGGLIASTIAVSATTGTVITSGTPLAITWEAEDVNEGGAATWESGTPTRVTLAAAGLWLITTSVGWAATATGARGATLRADGVTTITGDSAPASTTVTPRNNLSDHYIGAVDDYLEVLASQDSGTDKTATGFLKATFLGSVG